MSADVDYDARQDTPMYEPYYGITDPVEEKWTRWYHQSLDREMMDRAYRNDEPIPFEPQQFLAEPHVWVLPTQQTTRDTLAAMRYETPRLTAISVLFDIVTAIREKYSRE